MKQSRSFRELVSDSVRNTKDFVGNKKEIIQNNWGSKTPIRNAAGIEYGSNTNSVPIDRENTFGAAFNPDRTGIPGYRQVALPQIPIETNRLDLGDRPTAIAIKYPLRTAGAAIGLGVADHLLGSPIGGTVDFATFGLTDFKDEPQPNIEPMPLNPRGAVPPLSDEDMSREIDRIQRNIARDMVTLKQLQQMSQQGENNYYG